MAQLIGALIAAAYGSMTALRPRTPLFYRIVFLAVLTGLMGDVYAVLFRLLWSGKNGGFHVGYLGYAGMFFFLLSSYYGAMNSLADDGRPQLRVFRLAAGAAFAAFMLAALWLMRVYDKPAWLLIVIVPMALTLYFAVKHLIFPDVEMGIIRVMRPYNALAAALCVSMMLRLMAASGTALEAAGSVCTGVLLAVCMPVAGNGVRKWST